MIFLITQNTLNCYNFKTTPSFRTQVYIDFKNKLTICRITKIDLFLGYNYRTYLI